MHASGSRAGGRRNGGGGASLVGKRSFSDRVDGAHLVVVCLAIGERGIGIGEDVAQRCE